MSDFPGGPVVRSPPAKAGDADSIPGLGRPHVPLAAKAVLQLLKSSSPCSSTREAPSVRSLHAATRE